MAERTSGLHRAVTIPAVYGAIQNLLGGGPQGRARLAERLFADTAGKSVLELGCGPGTWVPHLGTATRYLGIDWNPRHIDSATREHGSETRRFLCGDLALLLDDPDFPRFDVVLGIGILHHLDDDIATGALATAARALGQGGIYIGIEPVLHPRQHPVARLLKALDSGRNIRNEAGYRALLSPSFATLSTRIETGLMRVPYSHCLISARVA